MLHENTSKLSTLARHDNAWVLTYDMLDMPPVKY
jgi:hypothetical protein